MSGGTPHKLVVFGSRNYPIIEHVRDFIQILHSNCPGVLVVSGGAPGVDSAAVYNAARLGMRTKVFRADWENMGPLAGMLRNREMAAWVDEGFGFWDGESKGTMDMASCLRGLKKPCRLFTPTAIDFPGTEPYILGRSEGVDSPRPLA